MEVCKGMTLIGEEKLSVVNLLRSNSWNWNVAFKSATTSSSTQLRQTIVLQFQ